VEPSPARFAAGQSLEGELVGGGRAEILISAATGDYLRLRIEQLGLDVAASLVGPAGEVLAVVDGPGGVRVPEMLPLLSPVTGDLRLILTPHAADAPKGRYRATLEEIRPGRPEDPERVAAERAHAEAAHWQESEDGEGNRKALAGFEKALVHWRAAGDPRGQSDTLCRIGDLRRILEGPASAIPALEEALALALSAGHRRGEAEALNNLGLAWSAKGDREKAEQQYEEALRLWQDLGASRDEAVTRFNLALFHRGVDPDKAVQEVSRALELNRALGDQAGQAINLVVLGGIYRDQGELTRAYDLLQQALILARETKDPVSEVGALQMIAGILLRRGELQQAIELHTQVVEAYARAGDREQEGVALSNLAVANLYFGETEAALEYLHQALQISRELGNPEREAFHLRDIGWVHYRRKEPEVALEYYAKVAEIGRLHDISLVDASLSSGMGASFLALGRVDEAIQHLEEAESLYEEAKNGLSQIQILGQLGQAWQEKGNLETAAECLERALALSRQRQTLVAESTTLTQISRLEARRGRLREAIQAAEESLRIVESVREGVASLRLRGSYLAFRRDEYELYIDLLMRLHESDPAGGYLNAALAASERARARALLDLLAEGRIDVRQGISVELKSREAEISDRISRLQSQLLDDLSGRFRGPSHAAELETELARASEELERLEWEIRREHPHYAAVRHPVPLQAERIPALLDEQTAFLEYSVGQQASFLFVVTRETTAAWRLPRSADLEELADALRQGLEKPGRTSYSRFTAAAHQMHDILIAPAAELLRGKSRLIVSPDGPLLLIPFEALLTAPAPASGRAGGRLWGDLPYLILDKSITYVPSASVLAELRESQAEEPPPAGKLFVGFGDPAYGPSGGTAPEETQVSGPVTRALWQAGLASPVRLEASRREIEEIARLYREDQVRLFLDGEASEENVKASPELRTARRIHFAVHGFLNERKPELSGLMLAQDGDPQQDGLLQVFEIFNLELHADLVVLSACDTALGQNVRGEGLLGVTRALLYAGAASVAVSLWQVADTSTADLMARFYRQMDTSGDAAEALRKAKLEMIRGEYDHPYHWAPFILNGLPGRR
jgi:CHAT domain-containing protein/Tfp pilus assembly protein PilF